MIQNYIFDLYGTLIDIRTDETMPILWKRMALFLSLQGAEYTHEELRKAYDLAVREQIERRAAQLTNIPLDHVEPDIRLVFDSLFTGRGVPVSSERIDDTATLFRALSMRYIRLFPNALEVLHTLRQRGMGVHLLSNAQSAFTMPELRKLGLVSCFDGIVLSSDVGIKKPDKAIFEHLISKYGLDPDTCLMIGNDEAADIQGAANLGIAGRYIHTKQSPARRFELPASCREIRCLKDLINVDQ